MDPASGPASCGPALAGKPPVAPEPSSGPTASRPPS